MVSDMLLITTPTCVFLYRIVQNYALREEAGTLAPEEMDLNKVIKLTGVLDGVHSQTTVHRTQ